MNGFYTKVSSTFLLKILGLGLAFIFQVFLGRILEPDLYGQYTMYLTYSSVLSIIPVLGMDRNLIKEIAKAPDDKPKANSLLQYSLVIAVIIIVILSLIIYIIRDTLLIAENTFSLFLLMLITNVFIAILDGFLQGQGLVIKATFLNVVLNNILKIVLFILLISIKLGTLHAALYSFIVSEIITILIRSIDIKNLLGNELKLKIILNKNQKKQFIKYSATVALISGVGLLLQSVDKIMISTYLDFHNVGIYKVSQNYVQLISIFITPFIAFWPVISKLYNENKIKEIEIEMKRIVRIVSYLVIPMFFLFLYLNDKLLLIFDEVYVTIEAQITLVILAFSFLIDAISGPIGAILTMTKYAKYVLYNNMLCLALNIVLNYILIGKIGIIGVAIGTGISIIANNIISIIEVKVLLGIFSYDYRNVIQISVLALINFTICTILTKAIIFNNLFLDLIIYGVILYSINVIILGIEQKDKIIKLLSNWGH